MANIKKIIIVAVSSAVFLVLLNYLASWIMAFVAINIKPEADSIISLATCANEGKIAEKGSCCPGLEPLHFAYKDQNQGNRCVNSGDNFFCANCGDGLCKSGENECNCPSDCNANMGMTCSELCGDRGNEDSYCDTYGGGLLPPGVAGTPACAEGGEDIGQTNDCNNRMIVDSAMACCCVAKASACKKEGEKFDAGLQTVKCCAGLKKIGIMDLPAGGVGTAVAVPTGMAVCANCGNGECGADENVWNCPEDCATEADRKNCVIFPENCEIPPAELKPPSPSKDFFNNN
jgi:hypothetical protein